MMSWKIGWWREVMAFTTKTFRVERSVEYPVYSP